MEKTYYTQQTDFGMTIWFEENGHRISFTEAPGNRHYEEYLAWIEAGNTPEVINNEV